MAYLSIVSRCPLLAQGSRASPASLSQQRRGTEIGKCAESLTALYTTGANQNEYVKSIGSTVCSMANTYGGFILFGVQDRKVPVAAPEHRIVGIPVGGDLLKEFGNKIESIQPEVYFEAVPQVLKRPDDPSKGVFVIRVPKS